MKSVLEIRLKQQGNLRNNFAQFQQAAARFYEDNDVIDDEEKVPEEVAKRYKHVENKVRSFYYFLITYKCKFVLMSSELKLKYYSHYLILTM